MFRCHGAPTTIDHAENTSYTWFVVFGVFACFLQLSSILNLHDIFILLYMNAVQKPMKGFT